MDSNPFFGKPDLKQETACANIYTGLVFSYCKKLFVMFAEKVYVCNKTGKELFLNLFFFLTEKKKTDGEKASKKKKVTNGCPFYMYQQLQKFRDHLLVRSLLNCK